MTVQVKNLNGTADRKPKHYDSWREFWDCHTMEPWPDKCTCCGENTATVGGHVHLVGDNKFYIIPMCKQCNGQTSKPIFNVDIKYLVAVHDDD